MARRELQLTGVRASASLSLEIFADPTAPGIFWHLSQSNNLMDMYSRNGGRTTSKCLGRWKRDEGLHEELYCDC